VKKHTGKTVILCAVLVISGGMVSWAARSGAAKPTERSAAEGVPAFLSDPNLASNSSVPFANTDIMLRLAFSVLVVIVLGAAALYVSKKVLPKVTHAAGKEIRVLETTYLGARKSLHLVEIGGQRLLLGSTNDNISTLAHLNDAWLDLTRQDVDEAVKT